jgi:serine/threonine protein kinase
MALSIGDHLRCPEGSLINNRYKVMKEVGCGNFAKVYKCEDTKSATRSIVAVKILKKEYANDAAFEADVLKALNTRGADAHKVVHMLDQFNWNRYPCFVFTLKGPTLRSRKMGVSRGHTSVRSLKCLMSEMLSALAFLHHEARIIHTDLKPENILLDNDESIDTGIGRGWTIADFGSASFYRPERLDSDLISTRPYRAPEVVLGMPWSYKADVWSIACIFVEIFHGARLFEVHEDIDHLAMFERRIGTIPSSFARQSKHFRKWFGADGRLLAPATTRNGAPAPHTLCRPLVEILREEPELADLLMRMLEIDPERRISCLEALQHPFMRMRMSTSPARRSGEIPAGAQQQTVESAPQQPQQQPRVPALGDAMQRLVNAPLAMPGSKPSHAYGGMMAPPQSSNGFGYAAPLNSARVQPGGVLSARDPSQQLAAGRPTPRLVAPTRLF